MYNNHLVEKTCIIVMLLYTFINKKASEIIWKWPDYQYGDGQSL